MTSSQGAIKATPATDWTSRGGSPVATRSDRHCRERHNNSALSTAATGIKPVVLRVGRVYFGTSVTPVSLTVTRSPTSKP